MIAGEILTQKRNKPQKGVITKSLSGHLGFLLGEQIEISANQDFSMGFYITADELVSANNGISTWGNGGSNKRLGFVVTNSGALMLAYFDDSNEYIMATPSHIVSIGETAFLFVTCDRDGKTVFYKNGQEVYRTDTNIPQGDELTGGNTFRFPRNYGGSIYQNHWHLHGWWIYNKALTDDEYNQLWNSGRPEEAEIPYELQGASQTAMTSGTLEVGKEYTIDTYVSDDDFTNVGASANASGEVFTATGTTPTKWTNGSSLRHTGNVLELKGENAGSGGWKGILGGEEVVAEAHGDPRPINQNARPVDILVQGNELVAVYENGISKLDVQ